MSRFIEGEERGQSTLFPERLDDWIDEDNPVRVIDVFVDELGLGDLGFERVEAGLYGDEKDQQSECCPPSSRVDNRSSQSVLAAKRCEVFPRQNEIFF